MVAVRRSSSSTGSTSTADLRAGAGRQRVAQVGGVARGHVARRATADPGRRRRAPGPLVDRVRREGRRATRSERSSSARRLRSPWTWATDSRTATAVGAGSDTHIGLHDGAERRQRADRLGVQLGHDAAAVVVEGPHHVGEQAPPLLGHVRQLARQAARLVGEHRLAHRVEGDDGQQAPRRGTRPPRRRGGASRARRSPAPAAPTAQSTGIGLRRRTCRSTGRRPRPPDVSRCAHSGRAATTARLATWAATMTAQRHGRRRRPGGRAATPR